MKHILVFLLLLLLSCSSHSKQEQLSVNCKSNYRRIVDDTVIIYDIEGSSDEGAEAKVSYVNAKISKSITNIYYGTGKATIIYEFAPDTIKVLETYIYYKTVLENVKSDNDMQLVYEHRYLIDYEGNIIGKRIPERIDIFKEFKDIVPFEL